MSKFRTSRKFPQLNLNQLKYCCVFYEGQHDDARTNIALAKTAEEMGAVMMNYCSVTQFLRGSGGETSPINGAIICDQITQESFEVRAKSVLICCGAYTNEIVKMIQSDKKTTVRLLLGEIFHCNIYFS